MVGFASSKQTFPDVETILHLLTLKRERITWVFFGLKGFYSLKFQQRKLVCMGFLH